MRYCVFGNQKLIFDSLLVNEPGMQILNPRLSMDVDGGSFSFTFPKSHKLWNSDGRSSAFLCNRTDQVTIMVDGEWLWEGFPSDYTKTIDGDYEIHCPGALMYLDNAKYPLSQPLNMVYAAGSPHYTGLAGFFKYAVVYFIKKMMKHHNDRINDMQSRFADLNIEHQKIYFSDELSVFSVPSTVKPPYYFSRIVNFESCYEALHKRISDDFGGFFYITKKSITMSTVADQDAQIGTGPGKSISPAEEREVLLINYRIPNETVNDATVYMGNHLLDYNVSESFDLVTCVIPRGHTCEESRPSKWWMKDDHSAFHDIEQYATKAWGSGDYKPYNPSNPNKIAPGLEYRVFLPNVGDNLSIVKKYGFREVVLDFGDDVVAKYPSTGGKSPMSDTYGAGNPNTTPSCIFDDGKDYNAGDFAWSLHNRAGSTPKYHLYVSKHTHTSEASEQREDGSLDVDNWGYIGSIDEVPDLKFITAWKFYYHDQSGSLTEWKSIDDYLNAPNAWDPLGDSGAYLSDWWYIEDYTRALKILSLDYLQNQQFDELVLEITADMIDHGSGKISPIDLLGKRLPVSADLFGRNLKPYPVTKVDFSLIYDNDSVISLGGLSTDITGLIKERKG